jgi:F-type H+-transporting ATPase subunit a
VQALGEKVQELLLELGVHPVNSLQTTVQPLNLWVFTNYLFFMLIAGTLTALVFFVASRRVSLVPTGIANVAEAGVEFVRNMCVDVIGEKDGATYFPFIGTLFFFILFNNVLGLIPGVKPGTGTISVTAALALITWVVFVWVGFAKNGLYGYMKSLIPAGVREMNIFARIFLGGFIFILEFFSTFIIRPITLAVRLFANMYAGHILLGIFAAFVVIGIQGGLSLGIIPAGLSLLMEVVMYAFEVFVAAIQAYVFAILTAVYIGSSIHAAEH